MIATLRRVPPLETAIVAVALAILVTIAVIGERTKPQPLPLDSYSTFDAASGGYRAWYELLLRLSVRAERFTARPAFLEGGIDTLVWAEPLAFDPRRQTTTRADVAALESWVRAGGRLLYIGHDDAAAKLGLLHLPHSRAADARASAPVVAMSLARLGVARVGSDWTLRWQMPKGAARVLFDDGRGPLALAYAFGAGTVVAVIDESLFTNAKIAGADRARFAAALALPRARGGRVSFDEAVHGFGVPEHWWQIVPRSFAIALGIAAAALLLAFAGAAARLGPPLVPEVRTDRSTSDFIDALAALFARGKAARRALADAKDSTTHAIARTLGLRDDAPPGDILARIAGEERRDAYRTLVQIAEGGAADEHDLVRGVALAQQLRKEYAAHGRPRI